MTRLRRIEELDRFFFLTFNVARGTPSLSAGERDSVLSTLQEIRSPLGFALFAYVVMPDHVHLLLAPQRVSLVRILRDLKSKTGFAIAKGRGARGPMWQRSYFDFICRRARDFWEKLDYIHQNPVQAGLVNLPEDWLWSSYRHYAGLGPVGLIPDAVDFSGDPDELLWPAPWRRS